MGPVYARKRSRRSHGFTHNGRTHFVQAQSAVFLGYICTKKSQLSRLSKEIKNQIVILFLKPINIGQNLLGYEVLRGLEDHFVFFSEILRRENILRCHIRDQKFTPCKNFPLTHSYHSFVFVSPLAVLVRIWFKKKLCILLICLI